MGPKDILVHLRLPFSVFLLPIYLFALSLPGAPGLGSAVVLGLALHLFMYPASNAFNSYFDQDDGPIGGIANPPPVDHRLLVVSLLWELPGLIALFFVSTATGILGLVYSASSKAYSWDRTRWKRFPVFSLAGIALVQGSLVVLMTDFPRNPGTPILPLVLGCGTAALFLLGVYPLTQVYQHEADQKRGDRTYSMLLGIKGTFIHSAVSFVLAGLGFLIVFRTVYPHVWIPEMELLVLFLTPALVFFFLWARRVWHNTREADFRNTMWMNSLASGGLNLFFVVLLIFFSTSS